MKIGELIRDLQRLEQKMPNARVYLELSEEPGVIEVGAAIPVTVIGGPAGKTLTDEGRLDSILIR